MEALLMLILSLPVLILRPSQCLYDKVETLQPSIPMKKTPSELCLIVSREVHVVAELEFRLLDESDG